MELKRYDMVGISMAPREDGDYVRYDDIKIFCEYFGQCQGDPQKPDYCHRGHRSPSPSREEVERLVDDIMGTIRIYVSFDHCFDDLRSALRAALLAAVGRE